MKRVIKQFGCLLFLWLDVCNLSAHEPFDCTSRLLVDGEQIQIEVAMGMDGVREILPAAGYSAAEIKNIVHMRSVRDAVTLPTTFSAKLFELVDGNTMLAAEKVSAFSDGLEVVFTLVYPRPDTGNVGFRAVYFEAAPSLKDGVLVGYDGQGKRLAGVLLSRTAPTVQVPMPQKASAPVARIATDAPVATPEAVAPFEALSSAGPSSPEFVNLGVGHNLRGFHQLLILVALVILAGTCWWWKRTPLSK